MGSFVSILNICFMILAGVVAFWLPIELLLISYAFLGPAHYLTEISWLHDRGYFAVEKRDVKWLVALTLIGIAPSRYPGYFDIAILTAFTAAFFLTKSWSAPRRTAAYLLSLALWAYCRLYLGFGSFLAVLLITIIHVYIFTGAFILLGALKRKSSLDYISLVFYLGVPAVLILAVPTLGSHDTSSFVFLRGEEYFHDVVGIIRSLTAMPDERANYFALMSFLSFAYTYHYLNWFSKTRIIGWHETSADRLIVIGFVYCVAVAAYLIDYTLGFSILLFLSVLHVVLEFPLNHRSFAGIGAEVRKRFRQ